MTHFGILSPTGLGDLYPMTTLGYELKKRGHRVTVIGVADAQKTTYSAGLEFQVISAKEYPLGSRAKSFAKLGKLSGLAALRYSVELLTLGATRFSKKLQE